MNKSLSKKDLNLLFAFTGIFVLSFLVRTWFNFFDNHTNAAFAFDAAEYLRYAQSIDLVFSRLFGNHASYLFLCTKTLIGLTTTTELEHAKTILAPLKSISISGPVFPAYILACYKLFGKNPAMDLWSIPIMVQCFITSLIPVLIAAIGNNCWNKRAGIIAGVLAAIYPGFIIGSGRLYSESFACFLLCLVMWLITLYFIKNHNDLKSGFLLGLALFALQMTRSIMVVLSFAIIIFLIKSCFLLKENRSTTIKYLVAVISGIAICLLPWLAIQKLTTGKASIVVDRVSNYNLLVGNDVDGLGWLSIPYQDCSKTDQENYAHILKTAISRSPSRWFKLMLDKPVRLFKLPWNDFKVSIGFISPFIQTIFHQLVLILAAVGLILASTKLQIAQQQKIICRIIILLVFLLHFIYLFFITLPRYALTAMPEVLLFAGAGTAIIIDSLKSRQSIFVAIKLIASIALLLVFSKLNIINAISPFSNVNFMVTKFALCAHITCRLAALLLFFSICWMLYLTVQRNYSSQKKFKFNLKAVYPLLAILLTSLLAIPTYCFPLRAHGRWYEWSLSLNKSKRIEHIIQIASTTATKLLHSGSYLAINVENGQDLSTSIHLSINNIPIDNPLIPAMALCQNLNLINGNDNKQITLEQEFIFQCLCTVSSTNPLDLRQWYFMPITAEQWQKIMTTNPNHIDSTLHIALDKNTESQSTLYGSYSIDKRFSFMPSLSRFSWEKTFYSAESESGLNDPFYDEKIALSSAGSYVKLLVPKDNQINSSKQGILNKQQFPLLQTVDHQYKESGPIRPIDTCLLSFKPTKELLADRTNNDLFVFRLQGQEESNAADSSIPRTRLYFSNNTKTKHSQLSYAPVWQPDNLKPSNTYKKQTSFDYSCPIMLKAFPGSLDRIELYPLNRKATDGTKNCYLDKSKKYIHIRCHMTIYRVCPLLSEDHYDIF